MHNFLNKEKYCQICTCPLWFYFTLLDCVHFWNEIENCQLLKSLKYFSILWPMKIMSDLNMSLGKMSDFVSFPLFGFTLVIKLRNFDFESHWNILIFFNKKRYGVRFEYVPWKNVWFCFISIARVHFSHKTDKFWFWSPLKYFNVFW